MPIEWFDRSFDRPAWNLAADEALLEAAEAGRCGPMLRFWESPAPFVVLGYTNALTHEVDERACAARGVPVLRRVTGGGTVVQGPGCWNYALVAPIQEATRGVETTNRWVMERAAAAVATVWPKQIEIAGHTDLMSAGLKFSGNAQKRKARFFLFHGTILRRFDIDLIQELLRRPAREPSYRAGRSHLEFVRNTELEADDLAQAFARAFDASPGHYEFERAELERLCAARYDDPAWTARF